MRRSLCWLALVALAASCGSTPPSVSCTEERTACGAECADLQNDVHHCGDCSKACDDTAACVTGECIPKNCSGAQCSASQVCPADQCVERACLGVVCPSGETCFGGTCTAQDCAAHSCPAGFACLNGDCSDVSCLGVRCPEDQVCTQGRCLGGSCSDGLVGPGEADVDCGGVCSTPCTPGQRCLVGTDCSTSNCNAGRCDPTTPRCADGAKNDDETDVDCGGSCPTKCAAGQGCALNPDCVTGQCSGGTCSAGPACVDGMANQGETDVDCGGPQCLARCGDGKACQVNADCASGACQGSVCRGATCTDGAKNGSETDVDCGGSCATKCPTGQRCTLPTDCVEGVCTNTLCAAPTCTDGVKNGTEADIDCGLACTARCGFAQRCNTHGDCQANNCVAGRCDMAPTCSDGIKNQSEADVDCGGAVCALCVDGRTCSAPGDCEHLFCSGLPDRCNSGFPTPQMYVLTGTSSRRAIAAGKINADAFPDLVIVDQTVLNVLDGNGAGTFANALPAAGYAGGPVGDMEVADMNGDGRDDVVISYDRPSATVAVLLSNGDNTFQTPLTRTVSTITTKQARGLSLTDLNRDGIPDVVVVTYDTMSTSQVGVSVLFNNGSGGLLTAQEYPSTVSNQVATGLTVQDLDGDGFADVALTLAPSQVRVMKGLDGGSFTAQPTGLVVGTNPVAVRAADLNGDGKQDLVVTNSSAPGSDGLSVLLGQGALGFSPAVNSPTYTTPVGVGIADFNGDARLDVVNVASFELSLHLSQGDGGFLLLNRAVLTSYADAVVVADFNGDGKPDVAVTGHAGNAPASVNVFLNE